MDKSYRIMKLKSGEEIITQIKGEVKGKFILFRPMLFQTKYMIDGYGRQKEVITLKNWLEFTEQIQTKIPKDFIATILNPDDQACKLYALEMEKEDTGQVVKKKVRDLSKPQQPENPENPENPKEDEFENKLKSLFDFMSASIDESEEDIYGEGNGGEGDLMHDPDDLDEDDSIMQNIITMTMFFPPEALASLVESGFLREEDFQKLIDSLTPPIPHKPHDTPNKRKQEEDYGNESGDWSPYLDDYLDDTNDT